MVAMRTRIMAVLLVLSILTNIYLGFLMIQPANHDLLELQNRINTPTSLQGFAELQAPAVMQKVEYIQDYPFVRQQIVEEGSMINISVEIRRISSFQGVM